MDRPVEVRRARPMRWVRRVVSALIVALTAGALGGTLAQAAGAAGDERGGTWTALAAAGGLSVLAAMVVLFAGPRRRPAPAARAATDGRDTFGGRDTSAYVPTPPRDRDLRAFDDGPVPRDDFGSPEVPEAYALPEDTATMRALAAEVHARRAAVDRRDR